MRRSTVDLGASAARLDAAGLAAAYREGRLTPSEAVDACLALIDDVDGGVRAFQEVYAAEARAAAAAATEELARAIADGSAGALPSLFGVPVALKDVFDCAGKVTTVGCAALTGATAAESARIVTNLERNGAVILGKVKTTEFAGSAFGINNHAECIHPVNPHSTDAPLICGGSSNGSGAAVASFMVPIAIGSDTGGSIRRPASFCGCVGLKTTVGLLPTRGVFPLAHTFDTVGPLARSVRDCAAATAAMMEDGAAFESAAAAAMREGVAGLRLAVIGKEGRALITSAEQLEAFDRAVGELRALGAEVVEVDLDLGAPWAGGSTTGTSPIQASEAYYHLRHLVDDPDAKVNEVVRARVQKGRDTCVFDYIEAALGLRPALEAWLEKMGDCAAWLSPTTQMLAITEAEAVADPTEKAIMVRGLTRWVNYLGLCAISLPSRPATSPGLPTSVQIVARPRDEAMLFRIAAALEGARGPLAVPPLFPKGG